LGFKIIHSKIVLVGKISVVINVVDEEIEVLPRVLDSVKDLADEIVIIDSTSKVVLPRVVMEYKTSVIKHERVSYVEVARNFGIEKAQGDWILILDPDEELSLSLRKSLRKICEDPEADYYRIPRKNIIFGKWMKHSRWWPDYNIRLFRKGCVSWSEIIHSVPETRGKGLDLEAIEENAIIHYHYENLEQYIERMNRYTSEHAKNLLKEDYKFRWQDLITKPSNEFLSRYFQGKGYKDGIHGLALASLQAFSELVMYLKIWQEAKFVDLNPGIEKVIKIMKNSESDLHYWQADSLLNEVGGIKQRIRRKLKI